LYAKKYGTSLPKSVKSNPRETVEYNLANSLDNTQNLPIQIENSGNENESHLISNMDSTKDKNESNQIQKLETTTVP